jgi:hypothetical protein
VACAQRILAKRKCVCVHVLCLSDVLLQARTGCGRKRQGGHAPDTNCGKELSLILLCNSLCTNCVHVLNANAAVLGQIEELSKYARSVVATTKRIKLAKDRLDRLTAENVSQVTLKKLSILCDRA